MAEIRQSINADSGKVYNSLHSSQSLSSQVHLKDHNKHEVPAAVSNFGYKSPMIQVYKDGKFTEVSVKDSKSIKKKYQIPQHYIIKSTPKPK